MIDGCKSMCAIEDACMNERLESVRLDDCLTSLL